MLGYQNIANRYFLCAGKSMGNTELTSFDGALLNAGVGNTNLMKMSSIVPPHCMEIPAFQLPQGALIPIAYANLSSNKPGQVISSAVAIAIPNDRSVAGVIMEFSNFASSIEVKSTAESMAKEAMDMRSIKAFDLKSIGIEASAEKFTTTFAACVLWHK